MKCKGEPDHSNQPGSGGWRRDTKPHNSNYVAFVLINCFLSHCVSDKMSVATSSYQELCTVLWQSKQLWTISRMKLSQRIIIMILWLHWCCFLIFRSNYGSLICRSVEMRWVSGTAMDIYKYCFPELSKWTLDSRAGRCIIQSLGCTTLMFLSDPGIGSCCGYRKL